MPGGKAAEIPLIENFPGFPGGIKGSSFVDNLIKQCKRSGAEIHELEKVVELQLRGDKKTVKTEKAEYTAYSARLKNKTLPQ